MTGHDILDVFEYAPSDFLAEAQALREGRTRHRRPRIWLLAAVVAALLVLAGCVAYVLTLRDFSLTQETYTPLVDSQGHAIDPPREQSRDVVSAQGHQGEPIFAAQQEWDAFCRSYDPEGKWITNEPDLPEIPNQYEFVYSCYTREMADKVDEIAEKHGLLLLTDALTFQLWNEDLFWEAMGADTFLRPEADAALEDVAGTWYAPGNLNMEMNLVTPDRTYPVTLLRTDKAYFPSESGFRMDLDQLRQWNYTSGGRDLLLALNDKGTGYIYADRGNDLMVIQIFSKPVPELIEESDNPMTAETLEALADLFDYSVTPKPLNVLDLRPQLEAASRPPVPPQPPAAKGFDEIVLEAVGLGYDQRSYAFYDQTGDGEPELFLGRNGRVDCWYELKDGEVRRYEVYSDYYLCRGNVMEMSGITEDGAYHVQYRDLSATQISPYEPDVSEDLYAAVYRDGQWSVPCSNYMDYRPVPQEEVDAVMEKYARIPLTWTPLPDFPLEDGRTLGQYAEAQDGLLDQEGLRDYYRSQLSVYREKGDYTHYSFADVNADGVEDLLLSTDGESYSGIVARRYGQDRWLVDMHGHYLCEGQVLESTDRFLRSGGATLEDHDFYTLRPGRTNYTSLDRLIYDLSTDRWLELDQHTVIPKEEAEARLARYPRMELTLYPIP